MTWVSRLPEVPPGTPRHVLGDAAEKPPGLLRVRVVGDDGLPLEAVPQALGDAGEVVQVAVQDDDARAGDEEVGVARVDLGLPLDGRVVLLAPPPPLEQARPPAGVVVRFGLGLRPRRSRPGPHPCGDVPACTLAVEVAPRPVDVVEVTDGPVRAVARDRPAGGGKESGGRWGRDTTGVAEKGLGT